MLYQLKKPILYCLAIVIVFISCQLNTKIEPSREFETLETQMAEIKGEEFAGIEISKKDTLELLEFWNSFYKKFEHHDSAEIIRRSSDSVFYPVYNKVNNYFSPEETTYGSIHDFLKAPFQQFYPVKIIPVSRNEQMNIYMHYSSGKDARSLIYKKDSILLNCDIRVLSEQISGSYRILRSHSFSFIRISKQIIFTGLQIDEAGNKLLKDSTTLANLYFPLQGNLQDPAINSKAVDTFSNLWYSNTLSAFEEPKLFNYKGDDEFYRFTWLRSFHNPIVIRFQKQAGKYVLATKEMTDYEGYIPNKFINNTVQYLPASKWDNLEFKLGRYYFWSIPTLDPKPAPMDGAQWILEANIKGKYRFATRHSPDPIYKDCCKYLLSLSKLKIPDDAIY